MAKNALIFSPFFFGLLFLVMIAFISEGVSADCIPGSGIAFAGNVMESCSDGCQNFCVTTGLPENYPPTSGVISGQCSPLNEGAPVSLQLCLCCTE
ncbi:hypothetical protein MKW94_027680 [Papaver nudicaule]|uniref:Uncharacterized protein n=1 Tax=Papaver nudicaule TaxID=74823 RepID=A0AA41VDW3_PAPNU|nr:hypothetical protein [Papaver nudicaule]